MRAILLLIFLTIVPGLICGADEEQIAQPQDIKYVYPTKKEYKYKDILVSRVIDAENIELSDGSRLKLIGVSPITGGSSGSSALLRVQQHQFLNRLLEGKSVDIEIDIQERDAYGRLLGYVFLKDGTFVNAEALRNGYAQTGESGQNIRYSDFFSRLYREARQNRRGLWK